MRRAETDLPDRSANLGKPLESQERRTGTLGLRPRVHDDSEGVVRLEEAEIGVSITDGRSARRRVLEVVEGEAAMVVAVAAGLGLWDGGKVHERTRSITDWRIEPLGDRVRHSITAQWWSGSGGPAPALLEMSGVRNAGLRQVRALLPDEVCR